MRFARLAAAASVLAVMALHNDWWNRAPREAPALGFLLAATDSDGKGRPGLARAPLTTASRAKCQAAWIFFGSGPFTGIFRGCIFSLAGKLTSSTPFV